MDRGLYTVLNEISVEVASHTVVRASVGTVCSDVNFNKVVAVDVIIVGCLLSHLSVGGEDDDAGVVVTDANLILGTYHSIALHTAQFAAFDDKLLVTVVELRAERGHNHFLSGCHIRSAADYLLGLARAYIHRTHVHVIAVGMRFTCEHLAHNESFESAFDCLHFLDAVNLQTDRCQRVCNLLSSQSRINIFSEPVITDIHYLKMYNIKFCAQRYEKVMKHTHMREDFLFKSFRMAHFPAAR